MIVNKRDAEITSTRETGFDHGLGTKKPSTLNYPTPKTEFDHGSGTEKLNTRRVESRETAPEQGN